VDPLSRQGRQMMRHLYAGAAEAELDAQGRVALPAPLLEHAGLDKQIVVAGMRDYLEVWDRDAWIAQNADAEEIEHVAERLAHRPG
jgi:MraZ protein